MSDHAIQTLPVVTCRLLTPGAVGAIAVVRVDGSEAWRFVRRRVRTPRGDLPESPRVDHAYFGIFRDDREPIDDVIVAARPVVDAPHPSVDICCHGGRRVVERILLALQSSGAGIATEVWQLGPAASWEAHVHRLADACLARTATRRGALYLLAQRHLLPARLNAIMARVTAGEQAAARRSLGELVDASGAAHRFHVPAEVVIVGARNAGKSSLVNRLAGREGAIVADHPGTTRDWVTVPAALAGVPVTLIDTAGGHDSGDALERRAIAVSHRRARHADLVIEVVDGTVASPAWSLEDAPSDPLPRADILVINKSDLEISQIARSLLSRVECPVIIASACTGEGIAALRCAILDRIGVGVGEEFDRRPALFEPRLRTRLTGLLEHASDDPALDVAGIVAAIKRK